MSAIRQPRTESERPQRKAKVVLNGLGGVACHWFFPSPLRIWFFRFRSKGDQAGRSRLRWFLKSLVVQSGSNDWDARAATENFGF